MEGGCEVTENIVIVACGDQDSAIRDPEAFAPMVLVQPPIGMIAGPIPFSTAAHATIWINPATGGVK